MIFFTAIAAADSSSSLFLAHLSVGVFKICGSAIYFCHRFNICTFSSHLISNTIVTARRYCRCWCCCCSFSHFSQISRSNISTLPYAAIVFDVNEANNQRHRNQRWETIRHKTHTRTQELRDQIAFWNQTVSLLKIPGDSKWYRITHKTISLLSQNEMCFWCVCVWQKVFFSHPRPTDWIREWDRDSNYLASIQKNVEDKWVR